MSALSAALCRLLDSDLYDGHIAEMEQLAKRSVAEVSWLADRRGGLRAQSSDSGPVPRRRQFLSD
eukprot:5165917-Amphidinium_carterae.1